MCWTRWLNYKWKRLKRRGLKGLHPSQMLDIRLGNNLGYFGPHEELLRSIPGQKSAHWVACRAGRWTLSMSPMEPLNLPVIADGSVYGWQRARY